jgi:processive 1,2-diacylglycerol beta-glucosyltransferase
MKALILSCNTGQGHNSAGKAVMDELTKRGVECEILDTLSFGSEFASEVVSKIHSKCVMHAPKIYAMGYKAAEKMDESPVKPSPCYVANATYANDLYKYITENGYDTIIMPHVFPSAALTRIKKKHAPKIRTYFIGTDYAYPPFLKETDVDAYFIAHEDLTDEFAECGIPREKLVPVGIPVSEKFAQKTDKTEARVKLGLPLDSKILLVMTGSMGIAENMSFVGRLLEKIPDDTHVVVMGGNNEKMKAELRNTHKNESRLTVLDFTTEVSLYMDASDVLFTKPGGLSTTEAAVKGIPMIHTAPIPGWEESNVKFFKQHGMSLCGETADELVTAVLYLLGNPWARDQMTEKQNSHINKFAARDICDYILGKDTCR